MSFEIRLPLFHDFIRLNGKWHPQKPAVIAGDTTLNWGTLDQRARQVANGLRDLGVGPGASVALMMQNCVAYVEIMYGVLMAGGVIVPINLAVNEAGIATMLDDADARIVFHTADQYTRFSKSDVHKDRHVFLVDDTAENTTTYTAWRNAQSMTPPSWEIAETDPCNIIYSSGTTGQPKGIKHLYRRRVQSMYELALAHRYHFGSVSICPIGLYSNIAWASLFCSLIVGGTCVIQSKFETTTWLDAVETFGVTHTFMVPIQFQRVLDDPDFSPERVASLEAVISGGSPLFAELRQRIDTQFGCALIELYGLTEGFMTTLQPDEAEGKTASVGKPVRGNDYILVDDQDQPLSWGQTGEICVRSVHWMVNYHNRPDATEAIKYTDPDGLIWLRTGDIGRTDEEGYLYIVDRKKDMIISGGQNIYPVDIEAVMIAHEAIEDVAVVGLPDEKWGETPVAFVVCNDNQSTPHAEDLRDWTNARVGKRQRLARVEIRKDLPRNPNGKILKRALREEQNT